METYTVTVLSVKKFKDNNFVIKLTRPSALKFKAGQFMMLHNKNGKRSFSIASSPNQDYLEFLIRMHPGGAVSPFFFNREKGDKVRISGPYGTYILKDISSKEIVFISAGTGIAPHKSMILDALERFSDKKITLIFGYRNDFYFQTELKALERKYKNFKLFPCCSNPKSKEHLKGHVTEHLKKIIKTAKGKEVYITGPLPMMKDARKILGGMGFGRGKVYVEKWV